MKLNNSRSRIAIPLTWNITDRPSSNRYSEYIDDSTVDLCILFWLESGKGSCTSISNDDAMFVQSATVTVKAPPAQCVIRTQASATVILVLSPEHAVTVSPASSTSPPLDAEHVHAQSLLYLSSVMKVDNACVLMGWVDSRVMPACLVSTTYLVKAVCSVSVTHLVVCLNCVMLRQASVRVLGTQLV